MRSDMKGWGAVYLGEEKETGAHLPIGPPSIHRWLCLLWVLPAQTQLWPPLLPLFCSLFYLRKKLGVGSMNKGACFVMFRVFSKDLLVFFIFLVPLGGGSSSS